jgi:hypothetical protein
MISEGDRVRVLPEEINRSWLNEAEGYAHPDHPLSTTETCVVFFPERPKKDSTFNLPRDILVVVADTRPQREPVVGPQLDFLGGLYVE